MTDSIAARLEAVRRSVIEAPNEMLECVRLARYGGLAEGLYLTGALTVSEYQEALEWASSKAKSPISNEQEPAR